MFPTDTMTKIDKAYLQKILRRARQNRYKREQTARKQKAAADAVTLKDVDSQVSVAGGVDDDDDDSANNDDQPSMVVPELATEFSSKEYNPNDFPL